jgi:hypothetical protein
MMAAAPQVSLPKQCGSWADLKAAYRLLSNEAVDPQGIQRPHRQLTRQACAEHPVVLCVQDDSELDFSTRTKIKGLGHSGNGLGQGLIQHSTLAVLPDGRVLGVLDQFWFNRIEAPASETRRQRNGRWRESQVWSDAVGNVGAALQTTRFVHVMDRGGDSLEVMEACEKVGVGFVIRARHDRRVEGGCDKLWSWMGQQPIAGTMSVRVSTQRNSRGRVTRSARQAKVSIRLGRVQLDPPWNHPGPTQPKSVWAVYVREDNPPTNVEPIDWMLVTSEPVTDLKAAQRTIAWYQHRWVIEEWHRVEKEGCKLEASQLDDATDIHRLAAIVAVISVRMIQLRDLAGLGGLDIESTTGVQQEDRAEQPEALQAAVPRMWIVMVSHLAKTQADQLTPRQFWLTIAKRGGWPGRKRDGRPGWKVIWRGWYDLHMMVQGAELHRATLSSPPRCG